MRVRALDTDVASYLFKQHPLGERYKPHTDGCLVVLSFQTVAELQLWSVERGWGDRARQALREFVQRGIVVEWSEPLSEAWAELMSGARRRGRPIDAADGWIAATAWRYDIPLVTHNRRHFTAIPGLTVITESP